MSKRYSRELKLTVVMKKLNGDSTSKLVREYELSDKSILYRWMKQYRSGNVTFEETRGRATKMESPRKGRQRIGKHKGVSDAEYIKYLEMENDIIKKILEVEASTGSSKYKKLEVIKMLSGKYPVTTLCEYLNASTSTYYLYLKRKPKEYDLRIAKIITKIHKHRVSSGYRTITSTIRRKYNINVNHKKVLRIMQYLGIKGQQHRRKYTFDKVLKRSRTYENVLKRNFNSAKPNEKWSIDITYIPDIQRNTYLVCIKDLYDKRIVNYKNSNNMCEQFVLDCVKEAFDKNKVKNKNLILHSDQGIHFSTNAYIELLNEYGVIGSHSRKGNCHDNAPIESFFSILKREAFNFETPNDFTHTSNLTTKFINYYNYEREQYGLNKKTPYEFHIA